MLKNNSLFHKNIFLGIALGAGSLETSGAMEKSEILKTELPFTIKVNEKDIVPNFALHLSTYLNDKNKHASKKYNVQEGVRAYAEGLKKAIDDGKNLRRNL